MGGARRHGRLHVDGVDSTANFLNEGYYRVDVAVCSLGRAGTSKLIHQTAVREAVSFNVFDPGEGDSSKGSFPGHLRGPVRPLLDWTTERR